MIRSGVCQVCHVSINQIDLAQSVSHLPSTSHLSFKRKEGVCFSSVFSHESMSLELRNSWNCFEIDFA